MEFPGSLCSDRVLSWLNLTSSFLDQSECYPLHTPLVGPSDLILSGFLSVSINSTVKVAQSTNIAKRKGWCMLVFFFFFSLVSLGWGEIESTWYVGQ
jgi:hypothetical protein